MERTMKESGIEWVGKIPENWYVLRNKNCFVLEKNIVGDKFEQYDLLSLTKKGIVKKSKDNAFGKTPESYDTYQSVKKGQIVMCLFDLDMSAVFSGLSDYDGMISPAYKTYNCNSNILNSFAKYWFEYCFDGRKYKIYSKSLRYVVNADDFGGIKIVVPPMEEQEKIVEFLDDRIKEIDAVILQTKKSIDEYKKYKQTLITEIVTKGFDKDVVLKDSSIDYLGEIPEHWNIAPLSVLLCFIGGYAYKSDRFCDETDNQVIRLGNVKNNYFILDEKQVFIDDDYAQESEKCRILENDILFTMTGTKGKKDYFFTLIVKKEHLQNRKLFINQRVGCLRSLNEKVYMPYYNYLLKYEPLTDYVFLFETGTANQGNLGIESISTLKLLLPPLEEQKSIVEHLDTKCKEIDDLIIKKEVFIDEMEAYKKSLIYEYVTGKKEVL